MTTSPKSTPATFAIFFAASVLMFAPNSMSQEVSADQQKQLDRIKNLVDDGGSMFKKKDYDASGKAIGRAQNALIELARTNDAGFHQHLKNDYDRIVKARKLLKSKGEKFDELLDLSAYKLEESDNESASGDESKISFVKQVAPIVIEHCGGCHIDRGLGRYSAATYESLKKGSRKGPAVRPRNLEKSRMITLITAGEMPPEGKGTPVPDDKLKIIKNWIEQGAKFDGDSRQKKAALTSYVSTDDVSGSQGGKDAGRKRRGRGSISSLGGDDDSRTPDRGKGGS